MPCRFAIKVKACFLSTPMLSNALLGECHGLCCVLSSVCRWFQRAGDSYIKVPFLGPISYLTLAVSPFCIVFAVLWAVYRERSLAWIGQDVLVRIAAPYDFIFNYNPILSDVI